MNNISASSLYVLIILSVFQNWILPAFLLIVVYSFKYGAVFLIPLAIMIDGYFGNFHQIPVLSFSSVIWFAFVDYLRPLVVNFNTIHHE